MYWNRLLKQDSYQLYIFLDQHSSNNIQVQVRVTTCVDEQIKYQQSNILYRLSQKNGHANIGGNTLWIH